MTIQNLDVQVNDLSSGNEGYREICEEGLALYIDWLNGWTERHDNERPYTRKDFDPDHNPHAICMLEYVAGDEGEGPSQAAFSIVTMALHLYDGDDGGASQLFLHANRINHGDESTLDLGLVVQEFDTMFSIVYAREGMENIEGVLTDKNRQDTTA